MAWDKDLPNNGTKIRIYPSVLTANFAAIELGEAELRPWSLNLAQRDGIPAAPPATPTRIDDTMILYSNIKNTKTEFSILDAQTPANSIQVTEDGALGSTTTQVNTSGLVFDTTPATTLTFGKNNMVTACGSVDATGGGTGLFNCTTAGGGGTYTITFTKAMASANYHVIATARFSGTQPRTCNFRSKLVGSFIIDVRRRSDALVAEPFDFVVVGGL